MTVAAILANKGSEVATIEADAALSAAVAELARRKIGALVVTDGGEVVGIVSERDLVGCLASRGAGALDRPVSEAMTAPAVTIDPNTPILTALALMTQRRFRHLPIVQGGQLAGLVSIGDLVKHRIDAIESEAQAMRSYIQSA
ncbi:MAG: CBS domain-containing protein [Sphingomicrobium sp.]